MALLAALLAANCLLLAAPPGLIRTAGALVILMLPGLVLAEVLWVGAPLFLRCTVGAGLGYALIVVAGLALAYLPGPISRWGVLALADGLALALVVALFRSQRSAALSGSRGWVVPLLIVLLIAGFFRFGSLGYSEFQGDEVKAMLPAARALEGQPNALIEGRKKGPAEILLPMLPWRLAETTDEASARLPFALAGLGTVATLFLLGRKLGGDPTGLAAAGVAALNGLLIAFSRIVQYQSIVLWMSALAVLCAWEWHERGQTRWALLTGLFMGIGLLAHYDALVVVPVLAYIAFVSFSPGAPGRRREWWRDMLLALLCTALVALPFYGPYLLTSQAAATQTYLGGRIGDGLVKNKIGSFLAYSIAYCSFIYIAFTGGLVLAFVAARIYHAPAVRRVAGARIWLPGLLVIAAIALMVWPARLTAGNVDFAPFAWLLILLAVIFLPSGSHVLRGTLIWLAMSFLGYNFLLADPRTHIYGIFLPWSLIAGAALAWLCAAVALDRRGGTRWRWGGIALAGCVAACFGPFLFDRYLGHNGGRGQDWPTVIEALAWAPKPYATPPVVGVFGVVHRAGWKGIGALYAEGKLIGDFDSNERPELTSWYVPAAYRLSRSDPAQCGSRPRYYFVANDLVDAQDRWPVTPADLDGYAEAGRVETPNGRAVTIYEAKPIDSEIGRLDEAALARRFDERAIPALFTTGPQPSHKIGANFGDRIRLAGYEAWQAGEDIVLALFWDALQAPRDDYQVFVHLESGPDGIGPAGVWGQSDGPPACGGSPTGSWQPGDRIVDRHVVSPAPEAVPGDYSLIAGLYRLDTGDRLPVIDESGQALGDSAVLKTVTLPLR